MNNCLWKVPTKFDSPDNFSEINIMVDFVKNEEKFADQIEETLIILEKSYKSFSSVLGGMPKISKLSGNAQIIPHFRKMLMSKYRQADKFEEYGKKFTQLRTEVSNPLRDLFKMKRKQFINNLNDLKASVENPLNDLKKSVNGYEKYFSKIIQLTTGNQKNPMNQVPLIQKALIALDAKMIKMQDHYILFHTNYVNYCKKRNSIFEEINTFFNDNSPKYVDLIKSISDVDPSFGIESPDNANEMYSSSCSAAQVEVLPPIFVTIECETIIEGFVPGQAYELISSNGDIWSIKGNDGGIYGVPCEYIRPKRK